jgi:GTPase SAR1 family protein
MESKLHVTVARFTVTPLSHRPQVLLVGQYSVGKTSFIRYLLGRDFPGQRIGPEPTTDRFCAIMDGPDERVIPGNALAVSMEHPFRGLERFGVAFLNRFEGCQLPSNVLRNITLIDTVCCCYSKI